MLEDTRGRKPAPIFTADNWNTFRTCAV